MASLEAQILELWGEITAATHRFLELIAELDDSRRWGGAGMASCAQWLNLHCGIGDVSARERLRVAHAIRRLPKINAAFRDGQISYSKVRAMTRVANPENEDILLNIAHHGTAAHVERTVRLFRRAMRLEVVVHIDQRLLSDQAPESTDAALCELEDGPTLAAETARRLACDGPLIGLVEDEDGHPLDVGRKTRAIPIAIQRALKARDGGCRFPGCTHTRFTEGHHIEHWAEGGETKLENLVTLCHFHHHLVHEGGYGLERTGAGEFRFSRPDGTPLEDYYLVNECFRGNRLGELSEKRGIRIGPETIAGRWGGETMDYDIAIGVLLAARERTRGETIA